MASAALDLGLRGVAVGLFLAICAVLLRYGRTLVLASIGFALMATAQIPKGWRADLVAGCGRLLIALVVGIAIHIVLYRELTVG